MSDLHERIAALSPAKRALLERRLRDKAERENVDPIRPRDPGTMPPLSFGQQRFWFLEQWEPGNAAYNTPLVLRIDGALDGEALDRAVGEVVRRHEALRTTFAVEGSSPVQVIHAPEQVRLPRIDLTVGVDDERAAAASRLAAEHVSAPFDLVHGPLWRGTLIRLGPTSHVFALAIHHSVFDGWSSGLLVREILALYDAFSTGQPSPLAELPVQYADFAAWQRRTLTGDRFARQLSYWREHLRDLPTLQLPTDHCRPHGQTFNGAVHEMRLPSDVVEALKALGRHESVTLFMTLLAAFNTLLHRYTGQTDLVVGTPIAGRTRVELEPLIGFFVNMLVLRTDAGGDPTFRELLGRIRQVAFDAYAHQDVPFEKLVEDLRPRRDPDRNPLFQVAFALQNHGAWAPGDRLKVTRVRIPQTYTRFDLEVHFHETVDGLVGRFVYNTSLFEPVTVERMAAHFDVIVRAILLNPDQPISELPLLTAEERRQLLVARNQTRTGYPRDACIHTLFEARARAAPDAIAGVFGADTITCRELNERANRLARQLARLGVGPDVRVGICVEPSIELLVGLLGTLKAGGAYVPLDPTYPRERMAAMLDDAQAPVLLTQESLQAAVPAADASVLCLDTVRLDHFSGENLPATSTSADLAYVIYTSGSTGRPKGVAVPHRAVVRLVVDTNYIQLKAADRVAQASNVSFDAATFEIWGALLNGATLVGIPQHVLLSPTSLAEALQQHRISVLFLTTALFNRMAADVPQAFRTLRYLLFGGETCDPKWVRRILAHGAPRHLLHVYGPTENTTFSTFQEVETVPPSATTVPIGQPIANTRTYVLDGRLQPVPAGVVGELYLGGDGLAREYLNRPDTTAERFVSDPFVDDPSARMYRTGDFVRYRFDGVIDFVGRVDRQVKLRGFRIELQEIEVALLRHPDVSAAVVITRSRSESDTMLVGYVTPSNTVRPASDDLRVFLRQTLPEYMIPSAVVVLDALPLTPNGKIDHAALPDPVRDRQVSAQSVVEPTTSLERAIVGMWEELLGISPIGIHQNFFDLGGHSLLAIQFITRLEKELGKTLPVAVLFQTPTIARLVEILDDDARPPEWSSLIPVHPSGSDAPFFWVHGDSSNAVLPAYLGANRPLYAFEHQAHDGTAARYTTVETIAAHYLRELRTVRPQGPHFLGGYSFGAVVAYEMAQQLRRAGEEVGLLFMLDPPGKVRRGTEPFRDRLWRHARGLAGLGVGEQLASLIARVVASVRQRGRARARMVTARCQELQWKLRLRRGLQLPPSLRSPYVLDVYRQALRCYVPSPYSGRVVVFSSKDASYSPPMDWLTLISGGLEALEGAGAHNELVKEPYVAPWATRLRDALASGAAQQVSRMDHVSAGDFETRRATASVSI